MTEITINRTCAIIDRCEQFTSGRVGARIKFLFSAEWAGLNRTAVFTNGDTTIDVLNVTDECVIPHEVLAISGKKLKVGVYGFTADDNGNIEIAIPTVYAELGKVVKGADPIGDESTEPSLHVWAQLQALIGNLDDLETTAKNNLVAAINEAAQTGGGGSAILAMRVSGGYIQYTTDNVTWENLIAVADLKGPKGDTGADGHTPVKGVDYFTEADKNEIAEDAASKVNLSSYRTAAAQDVIDSGKVDKVTGKGLSSNDYTDAAKAKVDAIPSDPMYTDTVYDDTALKNRVSTIEGKEAFWDAKSDFSGSYNDLTNKPTIPTVPTNEINANTAARHTHSNKALLDTYNQTEANIADAVSKKHNHSNKTVLDGITAQKVTEWNGKSNFSGSYNDLIDKPTIPAAVTDDHINSLIDAKLGVIENGSY